MSKGSKAAPAPEIEDIEEDEGFDMDAVIKALVVDKMAQLPKSVQKRVRALKNLHGKFADQEKEYQKEVRELEFKYEKIFAPIFQKRATIIAGEYEPNEEEAKWEDEAAVVAAEAENKKAGTKPLFEESAKGVPKYWYTVMQNNQLVSEIIFPADEEALSFLRDIRCTLLQGDQHGFDLDFHFAENPYFTNTVLKKTYHLIDDVEFSQLVFDHATGTKINWKSGKNLTVKLITKKPKPNKKAGKKVAAKPKVEEEPQDSFFNFFAPMEGAEDDDDEDGGFMEGMMEADFEVGCTFKDKLIPQAVRWYTGEAAEFEDYGDDEGFEGEDGEDGEDDDEEDEDDDEEEPPARGPKRGGRGGHEHGGHSHEHGGHDHSHGHKHGGPSKSFAPAGAGAPGQPGQPECKQQ